MMFGQLYLLKGVSHLEYGKGLLIRLFFVLSNYNSGTTNIRWIDVAPQGQSARFDLCDILVILRSY